MFKYLISQATSIRECVGYPHHYNTMANAMNSKFLGEIHKKGSKMKQINDNACEKVGNGMRFTAPFTLISSSRN